MKHAAWIAWVALSLLAGCDALKDWIESGDTYVPANDGGTAPADAPSAPEGPAPEDLAAGVPTAGISAAGTPAEAGSPAGQEVAQQMTGPQTRVPTPTPAPMPPVQEPLASDVAASGSSAVAPERIRTLTGTRLAEVVGLRHWFHAHPELSNREVETAKRVATFLEGLGLEVRRGVGETGVVARMRMGQPGPTIALRADMDALPVEERTNLPFASTVRTAWQGQETGVMHACGHDVHTATLLGVAANLAALRDVLPGEVVFVFQPAEEGAPPGETGGASRMLKEGVFRGVRPAAVLAFHTYANMPVGTVSIRPGPAWAGIHNFYVTLRGKGAHGGRPHMGVDPIVLSSQAILAFQTIVARTVAPGEPAVVTVGAIHGGNRRNIIPELVTFEGTVRFYDNSVAKGIERRIRRILDGVTNDEGASYTLRYEHRLPPVINDEALAARVRVSLERMLGAAQVREGEQSTGGEDFAFFAEKYPAVMYRVGVSNPRRPSGPHHTPTFRADDGALPVAINTMTQAAVDLLTSTQR